MSRYVNLRTFTHYSRFESIVRIPDLVATSKQYKCPYVAICDRMNLFGAVEFSIEASKKKLKPIIGVLCNFFTYGYLPIYIKNERGYKTLSTLLSKAYISKEDKLYLEEFEVTDDFVCLSGNESIFSRNEHTPSDLQKIRNVFGNNNFFFEIDWQKPNPQLLQRAQEDNIPIVCTSNVYFLKKEDCETLYVFRCIENNSRFSLSNMEDLPYANNYFYDEIDTVLSEGVANSEIIAQKCSFYIEQSQPVIPSYYANDEEAAIFCKLANEGLAQRLLYIPQEKHSIYEERLNYELDILVSKKFAGYFLVTADFVNYAKKKNIPVGPGRGSGAGCLVAYALSITNVDPIAFDLIFERFLNPERNSMPDFDIDFCPHGREEIIQYLREKYGQYNVANIITFGVLQAKGAIRDVARVFRMPFSESDTITKLVPQDQVNPVNLQQAIDISPLLQQKQAQYPKIFAMALKLEGLMRNLSKHAAGIIISNVPIYEKSPLYRDEHGDLVTQFDLIYVEYVGCVKFDFLGLRTLTILQKTIEQTGNTISLDLIPLNDKKTFILFRRLLLEGVFQFESAGLKDVIYRLKPDNIEDLIALNALYRPGPIRSIPSYIRRKNGTEPIEYPHPSTINILSKTYGVIVYQEQVMEIARICGGYSMGAADILRRAMGKKKHEEMKLQREIFTLGCAKNGIDAKSAAHMFDLMSEFSGYGFNKSHSTPYSIIAYWCAYLKAHYPLEFLASCLTLESKDEYRVTRYLYEAKKMNLPVILPNINEIGEEYEVRNKALYIGLYAIRNINKKLSSNIVANQPYRDLYDFVNKNLALLNKKNWDMLVLSGVLDIFESSRPLLLKSFSNLQRGEEYAPTPIPQSFLEKLDGEQKVFGFYLHHPIGYLRKYIPGFGTPIALIKKSGTYWILGEIITLKIKRKGQHQFAFLEIADESGICDLTVFSFLLKELKDFSAKDLIAMKVRADGSGLLKFSAITICSIQEYMKNNVTLLTIDVKNRNDTITVQEWAEKWKAEEGGTSIRLCVYHNFTMKNEFLNTNMRVLLSPQAIIELLCQGIILYTHE